MLSIDFVTDFVTSSFFTSDLECLILLADWKLGFVQYQTSVKLLNRRLFIAKNQWLKKWPLSDPPRCHLHQPGTMQGHEDYVVM